MHAAAYSFVSAAVAELGPFGSVVEVGSRDLNGSIRGLFAGSPRYIGTDVEEGPGVDVVLDLEGPPWTPDELVDAVVSCEVLEHVADWPSVLASAASYLRPGGWLILTAAGPGRRPHSGITGRRKLEPGEHYANVEPGPLELELGRAGFDRVEVSVLGADVRAIARRRTPLVVAVPFLEELERTRYVAELALADPDVDLVVLADNGSASYPVLSWLESLSAEPRVRVEHRPPLGPETSLYRIWNDHLELAQEIGANLVLVNNDVRLAPGSFGLLGRALADAPADVAAVYPDWRRPLDAGLELGELTRTRGAWTKGGLSGFAFAVRTSLVEPLGPIPRFDERYAWIYGDGDFVEGLELEGYIAARVEGLPLEHDQSTTARSVPWTRAAKRADTDRRKAKVAERAS